MLTLIISLFLSFEFGPQPVSKPSPVLAVRPSMQFVVRAGSVGDSPARLLQDTFGGGGASVTAAAAFIGAITDFESQPAGPAGAIVLNAPPGVTATLVGDLTVLESQPEWPALFGTRVVRTSGKATIFLKGPVNAFGFAGSKLVPSDPDPKVSCLVVRGGIFAPTASLTFEMGDATMPLFGNFGIGVFTPRYAFCEIEGAVLDSFVIGVP
jgi:hypothetical protein